MAACFVMKTIDFFLTFVFVVCRAKPFEISPKALCETTPHPFACYHTLAPLPDHEIGYDSILLYKLAVQESMNQVSKVSKDYFDENGKLTQMFKDTKDGRKYFRSALQSCQVLLSLALYNLNRSMPISTVTLADETVGDYKTWLSAAAFDLETCKDSFEYAPHRVLKKVVIAILENSTKLVSNSLSIISEIGDGHMDEPSFTKRTSSDWRPSWLSSDDRKFLVHDSKQANVVVAADGSGNYKTISEAIKVAPQNSMSRFVIYVKKGIYFENVSIDETKWNIVMFGDGMNETVLSGNLSCSSGLSTFSTATFAVHGSGFIARDMGFQNSAGPGKFQAVALLSSSDKSIFYRCSFDAYQDTLCTHSNRQFYRECRIYGTIDFIFGGASVVIQNSNILVKKPLHGQENVITAQGKFSPILNSGLSIQNCYVAAAEDLAGATTFLGRPWTDFSTVVFMESKLDSLIDPKGWLPWEPDVVPADSIYFAEYKNSGPGALTTGRVQWKGVRVNITFEEANNFTVRSFIGGDQWLPQTATPFHPGL